MALSLDKIIELLWDAEIYLKHPYDKDEVLEALEIKMKPVKSFRIDQGLIDEAKRLGIDVTKLIEAALAKAIKTKKCPYCGSSLN